jgi:hypothetical protein
VSTLCHDYDIDLGDNHCLKFVSWYPDRELNPQYDGIPDVEKWGARVLHLSDKSETGKCEGFITFDGEVQRQVFAAVAKWQVQSWEPLTVSPSLLCSCGDHGYIREGKWVRA